MENTQLKIDGMMCEACVSHVTKALQGVEGVRSVEVKLPGSARVQHENASIEAMREVVEEEGYEARIEA
jgi:copper chaperone CopZ